MRSLNSSTDSNARSCPISWASFFLGRSPSSIAAISRLHGWLNIATQWELVSALQGDQFLEIGDRHVGRCASSGSGALATSVTAPQLAPPQRAAPCYLNRFSARKTACLIPTVF